MSAILGLGACAVSSLCFGSMFVPVKKFTSGDGIFVQWVMCCAILFVGFITYIATGFPQFQPLAMLGGFLWAIGNLTAIPIINLIGLGMGVLIWGSVNCVVGWASGRFGLFGIHASEPASPILNYFGLALVVAGGTLFSQVRSNVTPEPKPDEEGPPVESTPPLATALGCRCLPGICYGLTFVPVIYIQDNPEKFNNPPKAAIDYAFSHYAGVYLTSTTVLVIYLAFTQNRPFVKSQDYCAITLRRFVANDALSQAITFPINAMVPGVCAAAWSVFYFKEIRGQRNLRILVAAVLITLTGAAFVGISK
ncbi:hypothetical protein AAVH_00220 [Aphelenchoides avenae]|nr:hypothetical protein AAVH_00220 [Aphelenchus avenae]